jgi:hypothetical protein
MHHRYILSPRSTLWVILTSSVRWLAFAVKNIHRTKKLTSLKFFIIVSNVMFWDNLQKQNEQVNIVRFGCVWRITIFWNVMLCVLIEVYWHFRGICWLKCKPNKQRLLAACSLRLFFCLPKCWYTSTRLHSFTSQKVLFFVDRIVL